MWSASKPRPSWHSEPIHPFQCQAYLRLCGVCQSGKRGRGQINWIQSRVPTKWVLRGQHLQTGLWKSRCGIWSLFPGCHQLQWSHTGQPSIHLLCCYHIQSDRGPTWCNFDFFHWTTHSENRLIFFRPISKQLMGDNFEKENQALLVPSEEKTDTPGNEAPRRNTKKSIIEKIKNLWVVVLYIVSVHHYFGDDNEFQKNN